MQLSEHLSLAEVTRSETAKRRGVSNMPTEAHIANFKLLAENVFEPIRKHFGKPIHISSGYRSAELNKAIGGAASSQHCSGEAIDIDMDGHAGGVTNKMVTVQLLRLWLHTLMCVTRWLQYLSKEMLWVVQQCCLLRAIKI